MKAQSKNQKRKKGTSERREKIGKIALAILKVVAGAGVLAMALCAPNALQVLEQFGIGPRQRGYRRKYYLNAALKRLLRQGLLMEEKDARDNTCLSLSERGREVLIRYGLKELQIPVPDRWDGKWRVLIFDIAEYQRQARNELRSWLEHLDFRKVQKSVWIHPYECMEIVNLLRTQFGFEADVLYMVVDFIENDKWLRREFGLE